MCTVFLIVALATYLCGCDGTLQPTCVRFNIVNATTVGYSVSHHTCSHCLYQRRVCRSSDGHSSCSTTCGAYTYYDCYNSYGTVTYGRDGVNHTCSVDGDTDQRNRADAVASAEADFPLGAQLTVYVDKDTRVCYTGSETRTLAIVGVVFFGLVGSVVAAWIAYEVSRADFSGGCRTSCGCGCVLCGCRRTRPGEAPAPAPAPV
jgi:hypothetical protein